MGHIPDTEITRDIGGSWSSLSEAGEATNLNPAHIQKYAAASFSVLSSCIKNVQGLKKNLKIIAKYFRLRFSRDATDVRDLTLAEMEGRSQAMHALTALNKVVPGFEKAKLRNFNMRIGIRDTRKIIGRYNLTATDVKNQARFDDSVGIFPEFIDGYAILILPTTGRYFEVNTFTLLPVFYYTKPTFTFTIRT